jgi:hypothetical protein
MRLLLLVWLFLLLLLLLLLVVMACHNESVSERYRRERGIIDREAGGQVRPVVQFQ